MTLAQVWMWLPPLIILSYSLRASIAPQDFWWHLEIGRQLLETGSLPTTDAFSFTRAGEPWVNQAWGMQLLLYLVYQAAGASGILALHGLIVSAGYGVLGVTLARIHGWLGAWAGVLMAFGMGIIHHGVRPQSISFLFFGLLCSAIERHRYGNARALRWLPLLFLLWGNLHGGFVFGLGALGLYVLAGLFSMLRDPDRRAELRKEQLEPLIVGVACVLALCINPEGPLGLARYVLGFFSSDVTVADNIEFQPLSIRKVDGMMFALGIGCLALALRRVRRVAREQASREETSLGQSAPSERSPGELPLGQRPLDQLHLEHSPLEQLHLDQKWTLLLFGFASLYIRRISPWFGFLLAPVLAAAVGATHRPSRVARLERSPRCTLYLVLGILVCGSSLPWLRPWVPASPDVLVVRHSPESAVRELCRASAPGARVLAAQEFASYQIFHCKDRHVFVDSRLELYPASLWRDYFALVTGRFDWERLIAHYQVDWLLLQAPERADREPAPTKSLVDAARESLDWNERYSDDVAVLFERIQATSAATRETPHSRPRTR